MYASNFFFIRNTEIFLVVGGHTKLVLSSLKQRKISQQDIRFHEKNFTVNTSRQNSKKEYLSSKQDDTTNLHLHKTCKLDTPDENFSKTNDSAVEFAGTLQLWHRCSGIHGILQFWQLVPDMIWALSSLPHHFPLKDDLRSITTQPRLSN